MRCFGSWLKNRLRVVEDLSGIGLMVYMVLVSGAGV